MDFSVVIPSLGNKENARRILEAIKIQDILPESIFFVVRLEHHKWNINARKEEILHNMPDSIIDRVNVISIPQANASIARNVWIDHVTTPYVYLIDDDNTFTATFFSQSLTEYDHYTQLYKHHIIYSPTIMYRHTTHIQSLGLKTFHFLAWRPEPVLCYGWKNKIISSLRRLFPLPKNYVAKKEYVQPMLIWGNSLLVATHLLKQYQFDITMPFVYEDLDLIYSMTKHHVPLIVSKQNCIYHMERDKTLLETSFLATAKGAYQKAKNRIVFVRKHATISEKIMFFGIGCPITSIMTSVFILVKWGSHKYNILRSYLKGIKIGILMKI